MKGRSTAQEALTGSRLNTAGGPPRWLRPLRSLSASQWDRRWTSFSRGLQSLRSLDPHKFCHQRKNRKQTNKNQKRPVALHWFIHFFPAADKVESEKCLFSRSGTRGGRCCSSRRWWRSHHRGRGGIEALKLVEKRPEETVLVACDLVRDLVPHKQSLDIPTSAQRAHHCVP